MDLTALLIIDVQNGLFNIENLPIFKEDQLINNLQNLIEKARKAKVPIFYIQHNDPKGKLLENGTENWKIREEIAPSDVDIVIQKYKPDSFLDTTLEDSLKSFGIARLVITGLATDMCVDTTVRSAYSRGYDVILIQDAHSTMDSKVLKASQIIDHHNDILSSFSSLKKTKKFEF